MKRFCCLLILFSQGALAANYKFGNEDVGYLEVTTENIGPIYEPLRMHITVTCKDKRKIKNLISPVAEEVIPEEQICLLEKPAYNAKTTDVKVTWGNSKKEAGKRGDCTEGSSQTFNITKLCSAWRR